MQGWNQGIDPGSASQGNQVINNVRAVLVTKGDLSHQDLCGI